MKKNRTPYYFLAPQIIFIFLLSIIPIILSLILSFGDYTGSTYTFTGMDNFKIIIHDPYFLVSLKNVFILMIFTIPAEIFLGMLLAVILNIPIIKGRQYFRTAYYLPVVTSGVAIAFLFGQFLAPTGMFNNVLAFMGIEAKPWLVDPTWARASMIVIIVWKSLGYYITLFLAGLQGISGDLYEAANIDGANSVVKFFKITIPQLRPLIFFAVITATIAGLNTFDLPNIIFSGGQGPGQVALTPGTYLYKFVMTTPDYGHAALVGWILAIVSISIAWLQFKVGEE